MTTIEKTLFQVINEVTNCRDLEHLNKLSFVFCLGVNSLNYSWEFDHVEFLGSTLTWNDKKAVQGMIDRQVKIIHSEQ